MALILDTGPLYASLDRSDADHATCRRLIETADEQLIISAPVLVEVDYWIHARLHAGVLVALLDDVVATRPSSLPRLTAAPRRGAEATAGVFIGFHG